MLSSVTQHEFKGSLSKATQQKHDVLDPSPMLISPKPVLYIERLIPPSTTMVWPVR
jgi:hypothetical protein